MDEVQRDSGPFRDFVDVLVRPRRTMRRILAQERNRFGFLILFLAIFSSFISNGDPRGIALVPKLSLGARIGIGLGALIASLIVFTLLYYGFSWLALLFGRFFDGHGSFRQVRLAIAWGLAPIAWALLYRIPVVLFLGPTSAGAVMRVDPSGLEIDPGLFSHGCAVAATMAILEALVFIWYLYVASNTLGEAHGVSAWVGFGVLLASFFSPLLVVVATVLATAL